MKLYPFKTSFLLNIILFLATVFFLFLSRETIYRFYVNYRKNNIVMLGNSIKRGGGYWEFLLKRNDVVNSGVSGFTSKHLLWILQRDVLAYKPKVCFIGGINDIGMYITTDTILSNYKQITDSLRKH